MYQPYKDGILILFIYITSLDKLPLNTEMAVFRDMGGKKKSVSTHLLLISALNRAGLSSSLHSFNSFILLMTLSLIKRKTCSMVR